MNKFIFITGASGSGKTTLLNEIEKSNLLDLEFFYFDRLGIPTKEEMEKQYDSQENWQRETTISWIKDIKEKHLQNKSIVLDRQARLSFIIEAFKKNDISNFEIVLLDCSDEEREKRLIERGHPELANFDMMNWAKYLRNEALENNVTIIDTTNLSIEEAQEKLIGLLK